MIIRKSEIGDIEDICRIYEEARAFMRQSGNMNQWTGGHPSRETALNDIKTGKSYVCIRDGEIAAVFYYNIEQDPTYGKINGAWLSDEPYGVVHRIARTTKPIGENTGGTSTSSVGAFCLNWCLEQCKNLRIDTHEDNAPMRRLLEKLDFTYCGIIWLANGDERMAYQKLI